MNVSSTGSGGYESLPVSAVDRSGSAAQCDARVSIDLIRDDYEGPIPHPFPCRLPEGHQPERPHEALVTWFSGEDD
jgi:hypothetical protein